jgi:hypothetical protein
MKFKSRKDVLFQILVFGLSSFFVVIILYQLIFTKLENESIVGNFILTLTIAFFMWIYFGTGYELTTTDLKYKSGPIRGKIKIDEITEIIIGKSLWSGLKPATSRSGLILKYRKFDEIYISPDSNDFFIAKILEINKDITITNHKIKI